MIIIIIIHDHLRVEGLLALALGALDQRSDEFIDE